MTLISMNNNNLFLSSTWYQSLHNPGHCPPSSHHLPPRETKTIKNTKKKSHIRSPRPPSSPVSPILPPIETIPSLCHSSSPQAQPPVVRRCSHRHRPPPPLAADLLAGNPAGITSARPHHLHLRLILSIWSSHLILTAFGLSLPQLRRFVYCRPSILTADVPSNLLPKLSLFHSLLSDVGASPDDPPQVDPPPPAAAATEPDDQTIEDLVVLLYFGYLFDVTAMMLMRTHEHDCCLPYDYVIDDATDLLGEQDLDTISMLGSLVILRPAYSEVSHKNALQECLQHARLWLQKSNQPIHPGALVTYAGLRGKLDKIMALDYFTTTSSPPSPRPTSRQTPSPHTATGSPSPSLCPPVKPRNTPWVDMEKKKRQEK